MKIVSLVEGAVVRKGSMGIIGVPLALQKLAERGHNVILLVSGDVSPGTERFLAHDVQSALSRKEGAGTFGTLRFQSWPVWALSISILRTASRLAREADLIFLNSLYSFPVMLGYLLARVYRKPYGIWPHGVLAPFQRKKSARKKWIYDRLVGRRILDNASVVFYTASGEQGEAAQLGLTAPWVVVPNGIDVDAFSHLPELGRFRARFLNGYRGPLVIFLARLSAKKGVDLLIDAMAEVVKQIPDVRLAIIGGPDPPSFSRQVQSWVSKSGPRGSHGHHRLRHHGTETGSVCGRRCFCSAVARGKLRPLGI